jgi:hypothetical protein
MRPILVVAAQNSKDYFAWLGSEAVHLLTLPCGHSLYILWGTYGRRLRPDRVKIRIQRLRCKICAVTCSVLPAFLLGHGHYALNTVAPYFNALAAEPISIAAAWDAEAPRDLSTLYRWFQRLAVRLALLLSLLEKELLELAPQTSLASLEKLVTPAAIQSRPFEHPLPDPVPTPPEQRTGPPEANASTLTLHALCQACSSLTQQLIRINRKLLHTPRNQTLEPLGFLNFFSWQKTGQALLSPLPQKSHPPPP